MSLMFQMPSIANCSSCCKIWVCGLFESAHFLVEPMCVLRNKTMSNTLAFCLIACAQTLVNDFFCQEFGDIYRQVVVGKW